MIWQPEFTDKTLSRKPGAVQIPGGRETENMLHRKFAAKRKHGEWFALSKDDIEGLKSVAITSDGY
ncbi:GIY-YIG nuclease family protein [Escherichia coli]|uniref:GIY-YIG nuclease family protein n=1 Tax=Escherichia coli TaxID=562 RepID=UPI0022454750|nr:GIY-YIG nuclease family protein [Escherichia coli]